jgi:hypothetical protein
MPARSIEKDYSSIASEFVRIFLYPPLSRTSDEPGLKVLYEPLLNPVTVQLIKP